MSDANQASGTEAAAAGGADPSAESGPSTSASDAPPGKASGAAADAKADAKASADGGSRSTEHAEAKQTTARVANRPSPMRPMEHPGAAAGSEAAAKLTPVQRALVARGDRRELLDFLRRRRGA